MKQYKAVISGIGVAASIGCEIKQFSENLLAGKSHFQDHPDLTKIGINQHKIARVDDEFLYGAVGKREARKLDRFCMLAIKALQVSMAHAGLDGENESPYGILVGNSTGGWSYVEPQMWGIYNGDLDSINPYVATTWFPTAPQGEISISNTIRGYSKTFSAGALSTGYALEHALYLLEQGYLEGAFVGGAESPLSPIVYNACQRERGISLRGEYKPFHPDCAGYLLGEGASMLVVESEKACRARDANSLANIVSIGVASSLSEAIGICLTEAMVEASAVDLVLGDGRATKKEDQLELKELGRIFEGCKQIYFGIPKHSYGYLIAADFAFQLLAGVIMLMNQSLIGQPLMQLLKDKKYVANTNVREKIKYALVYSRESSSQSIATLLCTP